MSGVIDLGLATVTLSGQTHSGGGSGTVTEIDSGPGVVGGPITSTGTLAIASVSLINKVIGVLPIINGGTNAVSAPAARVNLNEDIRTAVIATSYQVLSTDRYVAITGSLTTFVNIFLPLASSLNAGQELIIADESGTVTGSNTINVQITAGDTLGLVSSTTIINQYGFRRFVSNGISQFELVSIAPNIQTFTSSGTWIKPAGIIFLRVIAIGGGGGGGSGRFATVNTSRSGGIGGAGAAYTDRMIMAKDCAATESITVGAGGAGGASNIAVVGNPGNNGGNTFFGTSGNINCVVAYGGGGGNGGFGTGAVPNNGGSGLTIGGTGGAATGGNSNVSGSGGFGLSVATSGGGAGGGINSNELAFVGGNGGFDSLLLSTTGTTSGGGGVGGVNGGNGLSVLPGTPAGGGGGAGGGGNNSIIGITGGAGGDGGLYGSGGGGGGSGASVATASFVAASASGAGGSGAPGILVVYGW